MKQVRGGVVALDARAAGAVHLGGHVAPQVRRHPVQDVDDGARAVLDRVDHLDRLSADGERAGVA